MKKHIVFTGVMGAILLSAGAANAALDIASKAYVDTTKTALSAALTTYETTNDARVKAVEDDVAADKQALATYKTENDAAVKKVSDDLAADVAALNTYKTEVAEKFEEVTGGSTEGLATKVNIAQGAENANSAMVVNAEGNLAPAKITSAMIDSTVATSASVDAVSAELTKTGGINERLTTAEGAIDANETAIAEMKDATKEGSLAKQIADNKAAYEAADTAINEDLKTKAEGGTGVVADLEDAIALKEDSANKAATAEEAAAIGEEAFPTVAYATAIAEAKASAVAGDLTTLEGRVGTAEGKIVTIEGSDYAKSGIDATKVTQIQTNATAIGDAQTEGTLRYDVNANETAITNLTEDLGETNTLKISKPADGDVCGSQGGCVLTYDPTTNTASWVKIVTEDGTYTTPVTGA